MEDWAHSTGQVGSFYRIFIEVIVKLSMIACMSLVLKRIIDGDSGCLPFTKKIEKFLLGCKWYLKELCHSILIYFSDLTKLLLH